MTTPKKRRNQEWLKKRRKRGMRGYPIGTIAFYGPTNTLATKIAVGVILEEDSEPEYLQRWFSDNGDIREDADTLDNAIEFLRSHSARSVIMMDGVIGCPHAEGIDYPSGEACPQCPFWAGRDRFTGELIQ